MALTGRMEAYRIDSLNMGLDDQRTQALVAFGHWTAEDTATFASGMVVKQNANGNIVICDGTKPLGWAKTGKATSFNSAVQGEYIQLNGVAATNLAHPNIRPAAGGVVGVRVSTAVDGGTTYTEGAGSDYVVNYTNGTLVRSAGSTIPDGAYVYVAYQYAVTATALAQNGTDFWGQYDGVTMQGNKLPVITGSSSIIFTSYYNPTIAYAEGDILTAGTTAEVLEGYVTVGGAGAAVGHVTQIPSADDPFLGFITTL